MKNNRFRYCAVLIAKRTMQLLGCLLAIYCFVVLVGLIPVNNSFVPTEDGIEILVVSSAVHADIIVPISNSVMDWRTKFPPETFSGFTAGATHVALGWGDQGFFISTPTWSEMKISTAANALLIPSETCLHVVFTRADFHTGQGSSVKISEQQYQRLVAFVEQSFATDGAGNYRQIPHAAYGGNDAFFEARGRYHVLNTCNSWVGRALKQTEVRVPWLSPLPQTPMFYFPDGEQ